MPEPFIPATITVHLGPPDSAAENVTVSFPDYIKNVASSEIYPTWPEEAIRANIYAQITYALNRIYTEWYPSRGYDFDITSSTAYDQSFVKERSVFENISRIVDEIFNDYARRQGFVEPYFTQYCSGRGVDCEGLKQWDTVDLAEQGLTALQILQFFYGDDIELVEDAPVMVNMPSYPGRVLREGDVGPAVLQVQQRLARISGNYPGIPRIPSADGVFGAETTDAVRRFQQVFGLNDDGLVGKATWYRIAYIYTSVKRLAELEGEGIRINELSQQFPDLLRPGDEGDYVLVLQYYLDVVSQFYQTVPPIEQTGVYDDATRQAVIAFQQTYGLPADGIVGRNTWNELQRAYTGIVDSGAFTPEGLPLFPGTLRLGSEGDDVADLQRYLNGISGSYSGIPTLTVDGVFGQATDAAVRQFQTQSGLTPSGVVGEITWDALVSAYYDLQTGQSGRTGRYPGEPISEEGAQ